MLWGEATTGRKVEVSFVALSVLPETGGCPRKEPSWKLSDASLE